MVKDTLREIKKRKLQFLAILLITALGVGFFIGISVTGYDMRQTADQYMEDADVLDLQVMSSIGLDDAMINDIDSLLNAEAKAVYSSTVYASFKAEEVVVNVYMLNEATHNDLTLIEGRMPHSKNEAFIDSLFANIFDIKINDEITFKKDQIFEDTSLKVVGIGKSSLYLNKDRGYTTMGSGQVEGYIYANDLSLKSDVIPSIRYKFEDNDQIVQYTSRIRKHEEELLSARFERLIAPTLLEIEEGRQEIEKNREIFNTEIKKQEAIISASEIELKLAEQQLSDGLNALTLDIPTSGSLDERLEVVEATYSAVVKILKENISKLEERLNTLPDGPIKDEVNRQLTESLAELEATTIQYESGISQLKVGIKEYNEGLRQLEAGKRGLADAKRSAEAEFKAAEDKIANAEKEIADADYGELYLFERKDAIIGYTEFYNDSERIEAIGNIFPLIFFGVSILITLSTITQMIEENRSQLGVYKALGYSSLQASLKYVSFAAIAWIIGMIIGITLGFFILPTMIYNAYRIMYETPPLIDMIVLSYLWIPLVISFMASVGVAIIKALRVGNEYTANLLRPPLPKSGQRILLERIPFIWKRLSFLYKVSIRNLFRNKVRFWMTIIGVAGCTGLLITGFGISYSINSIFDLQFEDVFHYSGLITYEEGAILDDSLYADYTDVFNATITIDDSSATLYVSDDLYEFDQFFGLNDYNSDTTIINQDEVMISAKIAETYDYKVGDLVSVKFENKNYQLKLTKIIKNYTGHYLIIDKSIFTEQMSQVYTPNLRMLLDDDLDMNIQKVIMEDEHVLNVTLASAVAETFLSQMGNFDVIIYVVIGAAILLEAIVLTNLISMNISERKKELATLKVLGFYERELSSYIMRENVIMTLIATILGIIFGKVLHLFVVKTAEIDVVMFNRSLDMPSIIYAIVFTLVVSIIINLVMSKRLNKVNMNEALKTFDA